jgi:hypothetical protein
MLVAKMPGRKCALASVVALVMAYALSPYVAVWRLGQALSKGDAPALNAGIDWPAVRAGIKQDISDGIIGLASGELSNRNALPPFGASFQSGIAATAVDKDLTPEHIARIGRELAPSASPGLGVLAMLGHAFFAGPASFILSVRPAGLDPNEPPLRLLLEMHGGGWMVERVWIPQTLIEEANART